MTRLHAQQGDAEKSESDLRKGLKRGTDRDRRGGILQRQAALGQMASHQHRSADLPSRHQTVRGFPRPAREHRIAHRIARRAAVEEHANRQRIEHQREQMKQRDQHQSPSGQRQSGNDRRQPLRDQHTDEQQHAERQRPSSRACHAPRLPRRNTWRKPKYATASFILEMKRRHGRMFGSVTYSKVSDTRFSPAARGVMQ